MIETVKNRIGEIVEQACAADTNIFGYDIWTHHILPVIQNAKQLAPRFDADPEIVEFAALLHDYASIKDKAFYQDHHIHGPIEAENSSSVSAIQEKKRKRLRTLSRHIEQASDLNIGVRKGHVLPMPMPCPILNTFLPFYSWRTFTTAWELMKVKNGLRQNSNGAGRSYERMSKTSLETSMKLR